MKKVLCFGDSNTWGYNPSTKDRFPKEIRWTGILQGKLGSEDTKIIEEGLVGRKSAPYLTYPSGRICLEGRVRSCI